MAGYHGRSMSNNAVAAYAKGKKPVSRITKDDILKHGIDENITFFRWFVKNHCRSCEWHHSSPKYNVTSFYDIKSCCVAFKRADIDKLKSEYKSELKLKQEVEYDDNPCYAWVEYSISTYYGRRKYLAGYAIIHKCWAYIKDDYRKEIIRKKIDGKHFYITEKYQTRPENMPEDVANAILKTINDD
jgi:hypothetical protein